MNDTSGWDQYKRLVVSELERTNSRLVDIDKRLSHIERNLAVLNTKVYATVFIITILLSGVFNLVFDLFKVTS
jgi:hypothetical protein